VSGPPAAGASGSSPSDPGEPHVRTPAEPAPPASGPGRTRVLLIGMMGAGKTTVGRLLAERTGWRYLDNDALLVATRGAGAAHLLAAGGVPALRAGESAVLSWLLAEPPPLVASVAAGVVEDPTDAQRLAGAGLVVYLRARLETLGRRLAGDAERPWLAGDPESALGRLYAGRDPVYRRAARIVVDVDGLSPGEVCDEILDQPLLARGEELR
jgi:shikimate kinase